MAHLVRREPRTWGQEGTRWTLQGLLRACASWAVKTEAGMSQLLDRLRIRWRRGRSYVRSPDPHYAAKRAYLASVVAQVRESYPQQVLLYLDECTYERQPTLAQAFAPIGVDAPRAVWSHSSNTQRRIVATLDAMSGQVVAHHASKIRVATLRAFYQQVVAAYPHAERIYVVQDNWPVHFHPDLLTCFEPQLSPWPFVRPPSWSPLPKRPAPATQWPCQFVTLPTYASWCNPIEKLWRKLRQEVLHLHSQADAWLDLQARVVAFLDQFATGSPDLLHYVGLLPLRY